ncbi:MAG: PspC domain-containing protein [Anaerohalosphaera sp.]|nr:PspC domain-containing protein [Anaerohalosphaera sp.]
MRKLYMSKTDKKLLGICGGIGESFDIDPTVVRVAVCCLAIITALIPVSLMYLVAAMIIPEKPYE